ncbi:MAG: hypothetical protein ACLR2G_05565 [Phascolarctobacterium faecium]
MILDADMPPERYRALVTCTEAKTAALRNRWLAVTILQDLRQDQGRPNNNCC